MIFRRDFLSVSTPSIHIVLERSPSRSPALGRASHGDTKTRRKVLGRNADVLVGIIASLRFQVSGFSIFRRPSCMPDLNASLPIRLPAWFCMSLGLQRWGCSMQGSDIKMILKCLITHHSAPSVWGLFARRQLVLSEGRVFKWQTAEVPSDDGSLSLKYVNMWDCPFSLKSHSQSTFHQLVLIKMKENAH